MQRSRFLLSLVVALFLSTVALADSVPVNTFSLDASAIAQAKVTNTSYFKGLVPYTPVGASVGHGPQEYIGYRSPMTAPESGTLLLLGTGLVGIAGMMRRKMSRG